MQDSNPVRCRILLGAVTKQTPDSTDPSPIYSRVRPNKHAPKVFSAATRDRPSPSAASRTAALAGARLLRTTARRREPQPPSVSLPMAPGYLEGMNDLQLRPRMLRSLLMDRLPDEKRPFSSPAELSTVLSYVKTLGLLSEAHQHLADSKLVKAWSSAVDAWVDRLLSLISSNMPDKCWAGICLLGVTCEECSADRFLKSYSLWFHKLLSNIQPPSSTHFVKVASCSSLADLFTRLARFSNSKKDATSLAGKLIHPSLQLLNDNSTEAVWGGTIDLLCTLITFFPSSLHRHQDNVEAVLVSKIMSAKCTGNMSKKLACCLALLPKVRGDEDNWYLMMQKILIALNMLLNDAFQGLEEESKRSEIMRLLVPPGKEPPPPLGGQSVSGESSEQGTTRLHELLVPRVSALIHCCCMMLTNPYPVQVTVPIHVLLALVGRVLLVDGSMHGSLLSLIPDKQQELLCSELPDLHLNSLELLIAIIKGVRSQLLPHAANVVRLLTKYFRRSAIPSIRIKLYSIMQILLISMGVGMALFLKHEVINNASSDLNDFPTSGLVSSNTNSPKLASDPLVQSIHGKRKRAIESTTELTIGVSIEVGPDSRKPITPVSVKIAALRALEALLTVGGSLESKLWRSEVDLLLINVATDVAYGGKCATSTEESASSRAEFQLAALQALLASLLSPSHDRHPYLSQGLELFRRGKQETGTKLAAFCAHALLALEVLMHPQALPLDDFPVARRSTFDEGLSHEEPEGTFFGGKKPTMPSFNQLCDSWLVDEKETALYTSTQNEHPTDTILCGNDSIEDPLGEKHMGINPASDHEVAEGNQLSCSVDAEMQCVGRDDSMSELNEVPNSSNSVGVVAGVDEATPGEGAMATAGVSRDDIDPGKGDVFTNDPDASEHSNASESIAADVLSRNDMAPSKGDVVDASIPNKYADGASKWLAACDKGKGMMLSYDSDSDSMSSLPDIVDEDPDTE